MCDYKTVNCYLPRQIMKFRVYNNGTIMMADPKKSQMFTVMTNSNLAMLPATVTIVLSRVIETFPDAWTDCLVNRQAGMLGTVSSTLLVRIHGKTHVCIQGVDKPLGLEAEWDDLEHMFFEGTNLKRV